MERVPTIGIDFGTSYSCVGVYQNGKINIIPNEIEERKIPSYVSFTDDGILVGDEAKNKITNINNTIFSVKRLLGRNFEEKEIREDMKLWPFKVVKDPKSNRVKIQVIYQNKERKYYPEEIIAMILRKLKKTASKFLGKEVKDAVITVPCFFNHYQRQLIRDAGTISGINVLRIINELGAVGLTYGFITNSKQEKNILFYNLGGGYLNVSLICSEDSLIEVRANNGLNHLGGEDFDNKLVEYCVEEFRHKKNTY